VARTPLHPWNLAPDEAVALQEQLAARIDVTTPLGPFDFVAGADIAYSLTSNHVFAGVVVLGRDDAGTWNVIEERGIVCECPFPYIPGLLSFRETPVLLDVFDQLEHQPEVVMCDGQGLAHPRRFGLACHLGLWLDLPCLGCAKTRLAGRFDPVPDAAGSSVPLTEDDELLGHVVRTQTGINPVFVSPGHRLDFDSAVRVVLETRGPYRIPEPTRQADLFVDRLRREAGENVRPGEEE
jgi:deoxyribonuclease V